MTYKEAKMADKDFTSPQPDPQMDVLCSRLAQAQAIVAAINVALTDREDPDANPLTGPVLQRMAWAAEDLLEQAQEATKQL
jgi:hypothetical protein